MTFRPAPSIIFGLVLVVSVSLKLPGLAKIAVGADNVIPREIAAVLERHDFHVIQEAPDEDLAWVSGTAGACHVRVVRVAPMGWHRSLVTQLATGNQLFYAFGGEIYSQQPIVRTRAYFYWSKLNLYFGLSRRHPPVLALIVAPGCQNVPLRELAVLSSTS
jgi:hypothetical protein